MTPLHRRLRSWLASALLIGSLGGLSLGCFSLRYGTNRPVAQKVHQEWSHFFLLGMIGRKEVNLTELCPGGVARVRTYTSFVNGLLTIFPGLLGIVWWPRTLEVRCAEPSVTSTAAER